MPWIQKWMVHLFIHVTRWYKPMHSCLLDDVMPEECVYEGHRVLGDDGFYLSRHNLLEMLCDQVPRFMERLQCYTHFRQMKFIVKNGLNFGVDYVLYADQVRLCHSSYGVLINPDYTYKQLYRAQRSLHQSRKKLIVAVCGETVETIRVQRFSINGHR